MISNGDRAKLMLAKMRDWQDVAQVGIDAATRKRGIRNLRYLTKKYPLIAAGVVAQTLAAKPI
jgi:hypothetical protein